MNDRGNVPATLYTSDEARTLANTIASDPMAQDLAAQRTSETFDLVRVGSGETGVLVESLRAYADMLDMLSGGTISALDGIAVVRDERISSNGTPAYAVMKRNGPLFRVLCHTALIEGRGLVDRTIIGLGLVSSFEADNVEASALASAIFLAQLEKRRKG